VTFLNKSAENTSLLHSCF